MSRLTDLLREVEGKDRRLAEDLRQEFAQLGKRRAFGLNFERHVPETVELPGRPVRKGDKVRFLAERGASGGSVDRRLWQVVRVRQEGKRRVAELVRRENAEAEVEKATRAVDDLVVVAEFRDPIYPGLKSTGRVERGGDKPFHTVINSENYHALQALLYTHEGKVDAIYIDPPYNTGARDWKYNNDYVDSDDAYRHSKWLAMMERRLKLAKRLLNPDDSVLVVTIDEKEVLRLGLLLDQLFSDDRIQMITSSINPRAGVARPEAFTRVDEYLFFVQFGSSAVGTFGLAGEERVGKKPSPIWFSLMRTGSNSSRRDRPNLFYPIWVRPDGTLHSIGDSVSIDIDRNEVRAPAPDLIAIWPLRPDKTENTWQLGPSTVRKAFSEGSARIKTSGKRFTVNYLRNAEKRRIENGEIEVLGKDENGALMLRHCEKSVRLTRPRTMWESPAHDAGLYGSSMLRSLIPGRKFPFPKSLFAVEDALRFFLHNKSDATVVDFFSGSGTTCHAVMRLNKQDGGRRQCISVTNNEVSADEQKALRERGLRPGDRDWEALGICEYITKPRIEAAITGRTPEGEPIKGDYKFTDEFPMADGFEENVEFFDLTYQAPRPVAHHREFSAIAPLLWLKAGAQGRRIDQPCDDFDVADTYGVLFDLDALHGFVDAIKQADSVHMAFVITDDDRGFQAACGELPARVEAVRLYESYLNNFVINAGRE